MRFIKAFQRQSSSSTSSSAKPGMGMGGSGIQSAAVYSGLICAPRCFSTAAGCKTRHNCTTVETFRALEHIRSSSSATGSLLMAAERTT